ALAIAWKSPVKCRLMSSIGTTWAYPPPAAPPFTPKTGPSDGSRMQSAAFFPIFRSACVTPTVTVDLPSPAGVGLIPVTSTSRPLSLRCATAASRTFALYLPYSSISSSSRPSPAALSAAGPSAERVQHDRRIRPPEHRRDVVVGLARVHDDRLPHLAGEGELGLEGATLRVPRRVVVMVIEPGFPERHHFG